MKNNIVAIMYDFDKTLCTKDMQEYGFIPKLNIDSTEFWQEVDELRNKNGMDAILCYMYIMKKKMQENNKSLTKEYLNKTGSNIELFPGVTEWFERINEYGKNLGIKVEHYIISSGIKEIIEGSPISKYFKCIYASEFLYDEIGEAVWPKLAVNYTNKTQFLKRINKGVLDVLDDYTLNRKMEDADRRIPVSNMIYIGDGITDVPCMKLTKDGGGVSIAVYTNSNKKTAQNLFDDKRINYLAVADYRENSKIDLVVKKTIESVSISNQLKEFEGE